MIKQFLQEEEGQTLVEYGLLISLIAIVVIGVLTLLGSKIKNTFNSTASNLNATT
ncbi:Flp family type IVb pilin [bacterium]|nr:MAG: Flp family type IVb pilin [bacterium]RYX83051.1 MAG: Flp family type IVb pilin [bacterium]RYX86477.1 MAG: Flp family type IVb pilin [bacterium]